MYNSIVNLKQHRYLVWRFRPFLRRSLFGDYWHAGLFQRAPPIIKSERRKKGWQRQTNRDQPIMLCCSAQLLRCYYYYY